MAIELTYSPTVQGAIDDPAAVRQALRWYGAALGWPANAIAPIPCGSGEEAWVTALLKFPPLWLGQAFEGIERRQRHVVRYQGPKANEPKSPETKGPETMPVIAPSKATFLDPGFYRAVISDIEETTSEWKGKKIAQLQFQFVILDADGDRTDQEIRGWCSQSWNVKSKLYEWARILLAKKCPSVEDDFDSDKLKGKKCDLEVIKYLKQDGNEGTKIDKLYPYASVTKEEEVEAEPE